MAAAQHWEGHPQPLKAPRRRSARGIRDPCPGSMPGINAGDRLLGHTARVRDHGGRRERKGRERHTGVALRGALVGKLLSMPCHAMPWPSPPPSWPVCAPLGRLVSAATLLGGCRLKGRKLRGPEVALRGGAAGRRDAGHLPRRQGDGVNVPDGGQALGPGGGGDDAVPKLEVPPGRSVATSV